MNIGINNNMQQPNNAFNLDAKDHNAIQTLMALGFAENQCIEAY